MNVAIVSGARPPEPMGLALAEIRLYGALRARGRLDIRVVGRRGARGHARAIGARWIPARPNRLPRRACAGTDLVHLIGLDLPPPRRTPFVATVWDLSPLYYDDEGSLPPWFDEVVERAELLVTASAFTADELGHRYSVPPERVRVIGAAPVLDARDTSPLSHAELRELGIEPPFALRYGGYTKRKNVPLLLEAWARVPHGSLVLAGPAQPLRDEILAATPTLDRVVLLDYVPASLLAWLLRSADVLVSTSEYEGYGLPPLEALRAGTPVVAVDTEFVREVCGVAAVLVEPTPAAIGDAIERVFADRELSRHLSATGVRHAAGFGWSGVAEKLLTVYKSATREARR